MEFRQTILIGAILMPLLRRIIMQRRERGFLATEPCHIHPLEDQGGQQASECRSALAQAGAAAHWSSATGEFHREQPSALG